MKKSKGNDEPPTYPPSPTSAPGPSCTDLAQFYACDTDSIAICYRHDDHYHNKCVPIDDDIIGVVPQVGSYKDKYPLINCGCCEENPIHNDVQVDVKFPKSYKNDPYCDDITGAPSSAPSPGPSSSPSKSPSTSPSNAPSSAPSFIQSCAPTNACSASFEHDPYIFGNCRLPQFRDTSTEPGSLLWEISDGSTYTSSEFQPIFFPGIYTVTLNIDNPDLCCTDTATKTIAVSDVTAVFTSTRTGVLGPAPQTVTLMDASISSHGTIVSWLWIFTSTFNAPITSTEQNPTITFTYPGTYSVSHTVFDDGGCTEGGGLNSVFTVT